MRTNLPVVKGFCSLLGRVPYWSRRLLAVAACSLVGTLAFAQKPKAPPPKTNGTTIMHYEHTTVPPHRLLRRSDDNIEVFKASYNLTLSKPVGNSPSTLGLDGSADVEFHSRCYDADNNELTV